MSSNRYVPRSIQNIFDRLEARNERSDKESFSTELPKVFQVTVYDSVTPEVRSPTTQAHVTTATSTADNFYKYRARSLAGHNDLQPAPETAKFRGEYERLRNAHFQAIVRKDLEVSEFPQTGDVWMATHLGGNLVELTGRVRTKQFILSLQDGNGPAQNAHTNGQNPTTTVEEIVGPLPLGDNSIPFTFKNPNAKKDYETMDNYKNFINRLSLVLISAGFKASSFRINSTRRTATEQVDAMIGTRYAKSKKFFVDWVYRTYSDAIETELAQTINKDYASQSDLRSAMILKVKEMQNRGIYVSSHMKSSAIDLNSNQLSFSDAEAMEEALQQLKAEGIIFKFNWEGVADVAEGRKTRQTGPKLENYAKGVFDVNEHFHITLKASTAGE